MMAPPIVTLNRGTNGYEIVTWKQNTTGDENSDDSPTPYDTNQVTIMTGAIATTACRKDLE